MARPAALKRSGSLLAHTSQVIFFVHLISQGTLDDLRLLASVISPRIQTIFSRTGLQLGFIRNRDIALSVSNNLQLNRATEIIRNRSIHVCSYLTIFSRTGLLVGFIR